MTKSQPLQARLTNINKQIRAKKSLVKGASRKLRRQLSRQLRALNKTHRKLRNDRWKLKGSTAIIKYEVIPILEMAGVPVTSRKRWETFGNPSSDHYKGNRDADAVDGGTAENHSLADTIKRALTDDPHANAVDYEEFIIVRAHTGSPEEYRVQIIAGTHGTGPHIHIGVKRVSS